MNWVFGELSFGELSVGELSLGELSFGDMSGHPERKRDYGQYHAKTPVAGIAQIWSLQCAGADQPSCTAPSLLAHLAQHAFFQIFFSASLLVPYVLDQLPQCRMMAVYFS